MATTETKSWSDNWRQSRCQATAIARVCLVFLSPLSLSLSFTFRIVSAVSLIPRRALSSLPANDRTGAVSVSFPSPSIMAYVEPSASGSVMGRRLTNRNTNRYSVTALFSMAAEQDVEVEDDLARGSSSFRLSLPARLADTPATPSPETSPRPQRQDLRPVKEELCPRARRSLSRLPHRPPHPESHGRGRST